MLEIGNYSFSFKQTFSNPIFFLPTIQNTKNISKKLIKLNTTIQNQSAKKFTSTPFM